MPTRGLNERKRAYMLGKFRRHAVIAAGMALAAGGLVVGSAQAHPDPARITCTIDGQPAQVHNTSHDPAGKLGDTGPGKGLYYPVTDNNTAHLAAQGDNFSWSLNGDCAESGVKFTSSGTGKGWCGRSVGTGTGLIAGHPYKVQWESLGTQLILRDPSAAGSVNANPVLTTGSCTDGSATTFIVTGVITHTLNP